MCIRDSLNADHEEKHRKLAQDICDKMFKDAEKDLVGKSSKEVDAKIAEIKKAVDKAYADLDKDVYKRQAQSWGLRDGSH